jgi:oligopeptide/dipeptide ABC transporter ATP-binding protein
MLVTHDMGVVAEIADRVVVMYAGKVVEAGTKEQIFIDPQHPYTWGLFNSIPPLTGARMKRLVSIPGAPPSLLDLPQGCSFRPRCGQRFEPCTQMPELEGGEGHLARCWIPPEQRAEARFRAAHPDSRLSKAGR